MLEEPQGRHYSEGTTRHYIRHVERGVIPICWAMVRVTSSCKERMLRYSRRYSSVQDVLVGCAANQLQPGAVLIACFSLLIEGARFR